tara:strand:- start:241 stop:852 length:612 start_codon:yes stop_codon:yes gene_type:complete
MPYSREHKLQTRTKIVDAARILFNRHGFSGVTIDQIMETAGLTRGGFYNHFKTKEQLYSEAVSSFLMGRGAQWRSEAGVDMRNPSAAMAMGMVQSYLSKQHLDDLDGQCPLIALPSDIARENPAVRDSYQGLLEAMIGLFQACLGEQTPASRQQALSLAALCVGGMTLARTLPDSKLAEETLAAALATAVQAAKLEGKVPAAR